MAERKQAPVNADAPVEPRTRRGRRKMDDVEVNAVKARTAFDEKQRQTRAASRAKTAELAEKEKQDALKAKKRAARVKKHKQLAATVGRNAIVIGPIVAPMSVAWTGQSGFATSVLGWNFVASLLYAAAYELTTVFAAWMYHEARKDGDKGWEYRIATWAFAMGAGVQQWWHYSADWSATPRSVTYSTMTAVGVIVWELYARLIHRRALRTSGLLTRARPRIGLARWVRYPRISWTAWSMAVRRNFDTFDEMWTLAEVQVDQKDSNREKIRDLKGQLADLRAEIEARDEEARISRQQAPEIQVERTVEERPALNPGPPPVEPEVVPVEAGPEPTPPVEEQTDQGDEFSPTDVEIEAVDLILSRGERLNRTTCADAVRELGGGIATKRAADLAKWGRTNRPDAAGLKAV